MTNIFAETTDVDRLAREREGEFFSRSLIEYPAYLREEARWVQRVMTDATTLDDDGVARLGLALTSIEVRDVAWATLTHDNAHAIGDFLSDVVDRVPARLAVAPVTLLAFTAWLVGYREVCAQALTLALGLDPSYRMAHLVRTALVAGMDPASWSAPPVEQIPLMGDDES